jgi:hypothetical protein
MLQLCALPAPLDSSVVERLMSPPALATSAVAVILALFSLHRSAAFVKLLQLTSTVLAAAAAVAIDW